MDSESTIKAYPLTKPTVIPPWVLHLLALAK